MLQTERATHAKSEYARTQAGLKTGQSAPTPRWIEKMAQARMPPDDHLEGTCTWPKDACWAEIVGLGSRLACVTISINQRLQ